MKPPTRLLPLLCAFLICITASASVSPRERILINNNWRFNYGHAGDMMKDYTHGTEYFTYLAKAASSDHNKGPVMPDFDDWGWTKVNLPHDWVVDLPYSPDASHSHGYKQVGWKWPENSVGWYRYRLYVPEEDRGKRIQICFEGIFRDAQVFCNGFYLGEEPSGYTDQVYDLTEYLDYNATNYIVVRADASTEEGWYYEGAGIYRNVWLTKTEPVYVPESGVKIDQRFFTDSHSWKNSASLDIEAQVVNKGRRTESVMVEQVLKDADGRIAGRTERTKARVAPQEKITVKQNLKIKEPHLWNLDDPYLYTLTTRIFIGNRLVDEYPVVTGIRSVLFDKDKGLLINHKPVKIKGVNLHLDHAAVGAAVPDELWRYRIERLKSMGVNTIRSSHNPASPAMLDICDQVGMLVIDENRLMGINDEHFRLLERMIRRDYNHPSVIVWSIGNEEWAIEGNDKGRIIAEAMTDFVHTLDPMRPSSAGIAGGNVLLEGIDLIGYNYIIQNQVEPNREKHPDWKAMGSEETTGCGTRNVYWTDTEKGWMEPLNRSGIPGVENVIERGMKYYTERNHLAGVCYWTGFDYRGEPNPMKWPATGSQFGILDYCGFDKDEAWYLRSCWLDEPVLHIFPHWNLDGWEGKKVSVWAYSNCDQVQLWVNGKNLGRKDMPSLGHLTWDAVYKPGKVIAVGYKNGKKVIRKEIVTTGEPEGLVLVPHKKELAADGQDISVIDISVVDSEGREVPDADIPVTFSIDGPGQILGYGNGDPGFKDVERDPDFKSSSLDIKSFRGKAQVIVRSVEGKPGKIRIYCSSDKTGTASVELSSLLNDEFRSMASHPRLLLKEGEEVNIRKLIEKDPNFRSVHEKILAECQKMLSEEPVTRIKEGKRLLHISRKALERVSYLGYAYRMTADEKYAQRAIKEVMAVSAFTDWNPSHFLDVGEMAMAVALAYDWFYDVMTAQEKTVAENALKEKALNIALDLEYEKETWFYESKNNWNSVCNAGLIYGALAIYESDPELCSEILNKGIETNPLCLGCYGPDGGYPEGYGYWEYGTSFQVLLIDALETALGKDFGLKDAPGFLESATFQQFMSTPTGKCFSFSDTPVRAFAFPIMYWFADKTNNPSLVWSENRMIGQLETKDYSESRRILPIMLVFASRFESSDVKAPERNHWYNAGDTPVFIYRGAWEGKNDTYLAVKGGKASTAHAHMDQGTFIFEKDGVRWTEDLGHQNYHSLESKGLDIWSMRQNSQRWDVFRYVNSTHNTLTVNGKKHNVNGFAEIEKTWTDKVNTGARINLTPVFKGQLQSAVRTIVLDKDEILTITDRVALIDTTAAVIDWTIVTGADIEINDKGGATLHKEGKKMDVSVECPYPYVIKELSNDPPAYYDAPNKDTRRLVISVDAPADAEFELKVRFR